MSKYFAKYLPTEGEIVDYFVAPDGQLGLMYNGLKEFAGMKEYLANCKPAKLFLCSRDIQVGDNVTFFDEVNKRDELVVESLHEGGGVLKKPTVTVVAPNSQIFKVMGLISPQALWVKEGDEFEEEDWDDFSDEDGKLTVYIKCPTCKTFH